MSLTAAQARKVLAILQDTGFVKLRVPALSADSYRKALSVAKTRSAISGRLSFHIQEVEDGYAELSASLLLKEDPLDQILSTTSPLEEVKDD